MAPGAVAAVVVLGVGNALRQDEGVGVHAVASLAKGPWREQAVFVDGGTAVFDALSDWEQIGRLVVIDALKAGREPGGVTRVSLAEVADREAPAQSVHDQGLLDELALLQQAGLKVGEVVVYGVEPQELGWGTELSEAVAGSLPRLEMQLAQDLGWRLVEEG